MRTRGNLGSQPVRTETRNPAGAVSPSRPGAPLGLRFAVICTDENWQPWQRQAVELLGSRECGHLVGVIRVLASGELMPPSHDQKGSSSHSHALSQQVITCPGVKVDRGCWRLTTESVASIRAMDLDFLLVFGIERLEGGVLEAARHGAWCFTGFGERADEQTGVLVRPVLKKETLTEVVFVRLGPSIGSDIVLKRAILRTPRTADANLAVAARVMSEWPASIAAMIIAGCSLPVETLSAERWSSAVETSPSLPRPILAMKTITQWVRSKVVSLFTFDQWHIGIASTDFQFLLQNGLPADISWASPSPGFGAFYADPMGLEVANGLKVYCECYDHWIGKGDIRVLHYSPHTGWAPQAERVISEPFHMSYPYVFDLEDGKVCLPESCEAGVAYAYPLTADGKIGVEKRRIFLDFEIADPTLIQHNGYWYLFGAAAAEAQYTLRIWFAENLDGPWTPHPANPVKCDVQTARPAGPIVRLNGKLYRPSQDSTNSYGSAANIMEIAELSPRAFNEVCVRKIEPDPRWPYPEGVHTLTATRDGILIDAKVVRISPLAPLLRVANVIGGRLRRRRLSRHRAEWAAR